MSNLHEITMVAHHENEGTDEKIDEIMSEKGGVEHDHVSSMRLRLLEKYGISSDVDGIAPRADVDLILGKILELPVGNALNILRRTVDSHSDDLNFPGPSMDKIKHLLCGSGSNDMEEGDWAEEVKTEAGIIYYHSPYPEVRSVTEPFDDPTVSCETMRAYVLGFIFMAGSTALNTFFTPRQPAISVSANVLLLLLAPCGLTSARVLPSWSAGVLGYKVCLNPGPWTVKEQLFSSIIFTIGNSAGSVYNVYLVQKLPQYLGETWVTFGYQIVLALSCQLFGFGFAGVLRRFVVYPSWAIFPGVLPHLALNRALIVRDDRTQNINGWRLPRYRFFWLAFLAMFIWFWFPNKLFQALHAFNWMTWIAPQNKNLATVTGFYGGVGLNPWATFDWNVAGTDALVTPYFAFMQQHVARILSAFVILGIYYSNWYWTSYMPINSNAVFTNKATVYDLTKILNEDRKIDVEKYKQYGPPYFSAANVFGQGSWIATYSIFGFYVFIRRWTPISHAFKGFWRGLRRGALISDEYDDAHTRMMRAYPEVPDWWFLIILLFSFGFGVLAFEHWPTQVPWWSLLALMGLSAVFLIPASIMRATANVAINWVTLFQILAGVWWSGNPDALLIFQAYGGNFNNQADSFISDQKMAHYAKIPPRAMFRAQVSSVIVNCFIFVGMLNWMVAHYDNGTLCTWGNEEHFVCAGAVSVYTFVSEYGAFGVRNMFTLYPIFQYAIALGAAGSITCALAQKYGHLVRDWCQRRWSQEKFEKWNRRVFYPLSYFAKLDLAVAFNGVHNWTAGNNLSYGINAMYVSFIFMYYIKRRYLAWWEKYNYLLESGLDVGVAISGLVQSFIFSFGLPNVTLNWWGNTVSLAGVDYQMYLQKDARLPVPKQGYFGLAPDQYPMKF